MNNVAQLSADKCTLLAVHYASESNIDALYALTPARLDALPPELILRILLTYLPETLEPSTYISYVREVATRLYLEQRDTLAVDTTPVDDISDGQARKRVQRLHLLPLAHPSVPPDISRDILTAFLIHRAYRIDAQTGLLNLVLPLLRLGYEYYPDNDSAPSLEAFINWRGARSVEVLLSKCQEKHDASSETGNVARDLRGLVGPWMYGHNERKRRKLNTGPARASYGVASQEARRMSMSRNDEELELEHEWEHVFAWLAHQARQRFDLVAEAIEDWGGPHDVDLGGYADEDQYLDEEEQRKLRLRYAQSAYTSVYAAETDEPKTLENAHAILVRLADLMDFEPPPDLATSVELLPRLDSHASGLFDTSAAVLQPDMLLQPNHPLTTPKLETFSLLQMFVYSSYQLSGLGHHVSVVKTAKIRFQDDEDEQLGVVQKILHSLLNKSITDDEQWKSIRNKLFWLWSWGMAAEDEPAQYGAGIFGKVDRFVLEKEVLKTLLYAGRYSLVLEIYDGASDGHQHHRLPPAETEEVILASVMHFYDNATNGNRTRGGMRKASDILAAFQPHFPESSAFRRCQALLAATHALSFYSLTLRPGVPFQPVDIRVSNDPVSLLKKVLDQNPRSYTKLDDLISIGQNLVASGITEMKQDCPIIEPSPEAMEQQKRAAERRIIGMAIEAALAEDDFETAYSYVVNRLNPPSSSAQTPQKPTSGPSSRRPSLRAGISSYRRREEEDDISWRAALQAGRYRSPNASLSSSHTSITSTGRPDLRRLEQRMELLSQALLLAPPSALPEVLAVWRRCEEEMTALLAQEAEEEERHNDRADRRIPGGFSDTYVPVIQPRREMGRGAVEEAPMALFDVARGAAAAFGRSAFPLRGAAREAGGQQGHSRNLSSPTSDTESIGAGSDGEGQRVRKRDLVANAVTGGWLRGLDGCWEPHRCRASSLPETEVGG
ncbi:hypothetical protein H2199_007502 [Coniosporium tulheliwenetii]|uniref:Uncharacterized protein n=1 Tax=Coniosporium tulheliwenetii TaxID=3383036 RepID=A0ACC2YQC0_9PEZI|nr:hypothetical protein H2199_007502 [Cladosporium sp. JES 115]